MIYLSYQRTLPNSVTYYLDMFLNLLLIFCVHPDFFIFDKERDKKYVMLCLWSKFPPPPQVQWLIVHDDKVWKIKFAKAPNLKLNKKVYPLSVIKNPNLKMNWGFIPQSQCVCDCTYQLAQLSKYSRIWRNRIFCLVTFVKMSNQ